MEIWDIFENLIFSAVPFIIFIVFIIVIMLFVTSFVKGTRQYFKNNSTPEEHMPARLVTKRTYTWGGHGNMSAHISYYATFETERGKRLEFCVSSQFPGMYAEGDTGMLTYKGTRFIGFERERL